MAPRWGSTVSQPPYDPFARPERQQALPQQQHPYSQQGYPQQGYPQQGYPPVPPPIAYPAQPQYGYGGYGSHRVVRPARGLAIASLVLGGVWTAMLWFTAVAAFPAAVEYREAALLGMRSDSLFTAYDTIVLLLAIPQIATYVVACIWLMRVRENSEAMSPAQPTRARGWIWAGWLVPIVCLWFPFQVVRDILRAGGRPGGAALGWWWALFLVGTAISRGTAQLFPWDGSAVDPSGINALGPSETIAAVLLTGAFALWCVIVLRITREQDAAARSVQAPAVPAWH